MTIETTNKPNGCCSRVRSWGCLGWYLGPITYDLGLSFCSIIYFFYMVVISLGLSIYTAVTYGVFIGLLAPFCIGLPLLYVNSEILIGIVRFFVLAPAYGLLETQKEAVKDRVYLAVQNGIPLCNTCCSDNNKLERPKFIFKSVYFYKMIFYNIIIAPVCTWVLAASVILVSAPLYLMHHVFRYPFNTSWYKNKNECYGNQNGNKHCNGWLISNFGDCFALFLIGLVLLPLSLKFVIFCGKLSKNVCYYFLTNYYNPNIIRLDGDGEGNTKNGKGSVQLNEQFNVQFLSGNNNYHSVDDNLVSV